MRTLYNLVGPEFTKYATHCIRTLIVVLEGHPPEAFERRQGAVSLARLGCRHFSLVRVYDISAGANNLQLFRSVMIVTGHQ